ncbi:DNA binding domain, excisionase family [Aeromicrobium marinum DSM 15272]|uniref:DNA binding domain, excisionase family n=1 Tax=Aeromicrobium marinum DSM 15272 TaxID=585531 RepID=E2S7M2_9ACTN|nr:helix-turn-helix domain-containing protein [Aeromicrobium marinum]EFQ84688.1 DNA binding domain, excisionase family [Aeromicrobium marinum DSM 15272]
MTAMDAFEGRTWFSTAQAAQHSGWSSKTVLRALRDGTLAGSQRMAGGRWRIHRDDLDAWLRGE